MEQRSGTVLSYRQHQVETAKKCFVLGLLEKYCFTGWLSTIYLLVKLIHLTSKSITSQAFRRKTKQLVLVTLVTLVEIMIVD